MTEIVKNIKDQLQAMLESTDNKTTIEQIGAITNLVDKFDEAHTKLQNENKELIKDYKEVIKHTSFAPNGTEQSAIPETKDITFGEFLNAYKKN